MDGCSHLVHSPNLVSPHDFSQTHGCWAFWGRGSQRDGHSTPSLQAPFKKIPLQPTRGPLVTIGQ